MEKEITKNELGHVYGSRVSKNGQWLNLLIAAKVNGEDVKITCPVRIYTIRKDGRPYAHIGASGNVACICDVPVYADTQPQQEEKQEAKPYDPNDLPF